ncbi:MAG: hypothetical protein EHM45_00645 [Desulfobacteraceae bacterium]|nr:MAG: hypothetical protein EHM45_00645 [Desulfobacteraceae bacterium]
MDLDRFGKMIRFSFLQAFFISISLSVWAAPVSMEYQLGFNGLFQLKKWTPITVTLENRGRDIQGTLEIVVTSGSEFWRDVQATTYALAVELPSQSKKLCSFTVLIHTFAHPLVIRFRQGPTVLVSETLNLRNYFTEKQLVLMLGEKVSPDFLTMLPPEYQTVTIRPEYLPETWYGYEGAGLMILPVGTLKSLREKQFRALQEWIERGGYLVTSADLHYGIFNDENVRQLLEVRVTGFEKIPAVPGLKSFCGHSLINKEPLLVLKTEMPGALALLTEKGLPLILQKQMGLGRIVFLAFDYQAGSFLVWPGKEAFWKKILSLKPVLDLQPLELDQQIIQNTLIAAMPLHFPDLWLVFPVLVVYFGLFWVILRKSKKEQIKPLTALLGCAALSVLLAGGTWTWFYYKNHSEQISVNRFWHLKKSDNRDLTFCRSLTGLYAVKNIPYRFAYDLTDHPAVPLLPAKLNEQVLRSLSLEGTKKGQRLTVSLEKWSYRFLVMNLIVPLPISGKAVMEGNDLVLEFNNASPYTIKNGCFYFQERLFMLAEDLLPGQTLKKRFSEKEINEQEMFSEILAEKTVKELADRAAGRYARSVEKIVAFEALTRIEKAVAKRNNILHFCGWMEEDFLPLVFEEPAIQGNGVTFFEWTLPVQGAEE